HPARIADTGDQLVTDHADAGTVLRILGGRQAHRANASSINTSCSDLCTLAVPAEGAADSGRETRRIPRSASEGTSFTAREVRYVQAPWSAGSSSTQPHSALV